MPALCRTSLFLAPLACAAAVLVAVERPRQAAAEEPPAAQVSLGEAYEYTAIGEVIRANNGQVPRNGKELVRALAKLGDFAQLPVAFSAVAMDSGLMRPRVIIAPRPGGAAKPAEPDPTFVGPLTQVTTSAPSLQSPLSTAKATQSHVEGRLFLAANMEGKTPEELRVKTIEFISWNTRKKAFDFGVIDCGGDKPEVQLLDGVRCVACHKNRGPILGQGPWSNTTHNDVVRAAAINLFSRGAGFPASPPAPVNQAFRERTTFDGMSLVVGEPEVCDAAIRTGGNLARDREVYKLMTRSPDGRKALALLLTGIASPKALFVADLEMTTALNRAFGPSFSAFASQFVAIHRSMSNTLADYSPSGSTGSLRSVTTNQTASWGGGSVQSTEIRIVWGSTPDKVTAYDKRRAEGEHGMPSNHLPSNPRSFLRPATNPPLRAANAVSATTLARTIGLTDGDREFMAKCLSDLAGKTGKPKVTAEALAKDVFNSAPFAEALKAGNIPDREEFKDLFADALTVVANANKVESLRLARGDYASGPSGAVVAGQEYREPAIVPTTACLRCHDVRGARPTAFNPIPALAFDPFDERSRAAWAKATDPKKRADVLARMTKRLVADKDMPPEDAPEHERFRLKEAASFAAVKEWLEAELSKAKGN